MKHTIQPPTDDIGESLSRAIEMLGNDCKDDPVCRVHALATIAEVTTNGYLSDEILNVLIEGITRKWGVTNGLD